MKIRQTLFCNHRVLKNLFKSLKQMVASEQILGTSPMRVNVCHVIIVFLKVLWVCGHDI